VQRIYIEKLEGMKVEQLASTQPSLSPIVNSCPICKDIGVFDDASSYGGMRYCSCSIGRSLLKAANAEMDNLIEACGMTSEWQIDTIKETAMNRCTVKKSKRVFTKRVLDEAFSLLREAYTSQQTRKRHEEGEA
jgi:hypothetical protein